MKNALATTVIGEGYVKSWREHSLPTWAQYAAKNELMIIAFDSVDDLPAAAQGNAAWMKLAVPSLVARIRPSVERLCLIDSDVLISPLSPNIFDYSPNGAYGVVSQEVNLPYPRAKLRKLISWLRKEHWNPQFPLDSMLLATPEEVVQHYGLESVADYFCSGLIILDIATHAQEMYGWLLNANDRLIAKSDQWEEPYLNVKIQHSGHLNWLPYEFQAIWQYEMAWKYPFLYQAEHQELLPECIDASLVANYFLHFAGTWPDGSMWKNWDVTQSELFGPEFEELDAYLNSNVSTRFYGRLRSN